MNNRRFRENTFLVDFGNFPKKPTSEEVHTFVGRHLGVTREQLVQIQLHHIDDCVYVKLTNLALAQKIVSDHDNKHDYEVKGVKYKIRLRMADGGTEVKLHDLSENVTNEQISRHMAAYGEILSIDWLVFGDKHHFPGLRSGVRQVKMVLREPIKSYVTVAGETTLVTYPKQRQTCRHCTEYLHIGISCVQNKKLLAQKVSVNERLKPKSYSNALRGFGSDKAPSAAPTEQARTENGTPPAERVADLCSPSTSDTTLPVSIESRRSRQSTDLEIQPPPSRIRDVSRSPIRSVPTTTELKKTTEPKTPTEPMAKEPNQNLGVKKSTAAQDAEMTTVTGTEGFGAAPTVPESMEIAEEGDDDLPETVSVESDERSRLVELSVDESAGTELNVETPGSGLSSEVDDEFVEVKRRPRGRPRSVHKKK